MSLDTDKTVEGTAPSARKTNWYVVVLATVFLVAGLAFLKVFIWNTFANQPSSTDTSVSATMPAPATQPAATQPAPPASSAPAVNVVVPPNRVPVWPGAVTNDPAIVVRAISSDPHQLVKTYLQNVDQAVCSQDASWAQYVYYVADYTPTKSDLFFNGKPDCSVATLTGAELIETLANGGLKIHFSYTLSNDPTSKLTSTSVFYNYGGYWLMDFSKTPVWK